MYVLFAILIGRTQAAAPRTQRARLKEGAWPMANGRAAIGAGAGPLYADCC